MTRAQFVRALAALVLGSLSARLPAQARAGLARQACRLAMNAERVTRLQAQVGRQVLVQRSRRTLVEALGQFDADLREILEHNRGAEMRENSLLLKALWSEYRAASTASITPALAAKLAERNEEIAWVARKGARLLVTDRSAAGARVLVTGSAWALSQRVGKIHLLRGWALSRESGARELGAADQELRAALKTIATEMGANAEVASQLQLADNQYAFLVQAAAREDREPGRAERLEHIAKASDHLVEILERMAALVEQG